MLKSGPPTLNGGKSSSTEIPCLSTSRTEEYLMFQEVRILKVNHVFSGRNTVVRTKDGKLSILTKMLDHKRRELTRNSDSMSTDHSTLYPDSQ
jgi:hypothetical protein